MCTADVAAAAVTRRDNLTKKVASLHRLLGVQAEKLANLDAGIRTLEAEAQLGAHVQALYDKKRHHSLSDSWFLFEVQDAIERSNAER